MLVKATREGLLGKETASGWRINAAVPYVALPSRAALYQWIVLRNPRNNKTMRAIVLDVGPWYTDDDAYVWRGSRPLSETSTPPADIKKGLQSNGSGIDLSEPVWNELEMVDNNTVEWEFEHPVHTGMIGGV